MGEFNENASPVGRGNVWTFKLTKRTFAVAVAVACLLFAAPIGAREDEDKDRAALADIRATAILLSPELARPHSDMVIAIMLRDQIYRTGIPVDTGMQPLTMAELQDWSGAYKLSQLSRERANACNGKSILYMLALRAFGIRSRIVTLYATATAGIPVWSHASVDVRVDGKWVALDPTFNVALKAGDGTHLSWTAAVQKLRKGEPVIPDQDGKVLLRGQTLEAYRDRYGGNLQLLAEYALLGPWENGEAESLNPGWDGKIRYIDGSEFDAWNSLNSSFYKRIAGRAD